MSVTRSGSNKKYAENWEKIFGGKKAKTSPSAKVKSAKKKTATTKKAAKKSGGKKAK